MTSLLQSRVVETRAVVEFQRQLTTVRAIIETRMRCPYTSPDVLIDRYTGMLAALNVCEGKFTHGHLGLVRRLFWEVERLSCLDRRDRWARESELEDLVRVLDNDGRSDYAIAAAAGVHYEQVARVRRQRKVLGATVDSLWLSL